jgi:CBS domain-containing protein
MVLGVVEIFSGALVSGLWLIFIGMFLRGSAEAGYEQVLVEQMLGGRAVAAFMVDRPVTLSPDATIGQAIEIFLRHGYAGFPVCRDGQVEGLLSLAEVRRCPPAERDRRRVGEFMRPAVPELCVRTSTTLGQALGQMARADAGRLLVMDDGHLAGLVTRSGIARLVNFQMELDRA